MRRARVPDVRALLSERRSRRARPVGLLPAVLAGHEDDPRSSALPLRLLGGVHRLVLERRAPSWRSSYPTVGGDADADGAWPALRAVVEQSPRRAPWPACDQPPQTNEVGRAARPARRAAARGRTSPAAGATVRDRCQRWPEPACRPLPRRRRRTGRARARHVAGGARRPVARPAAAAARAAARSSSAPAATCAARPGDRDGRLRLTSYVWPDQLDRFERLARCAASSRRGCRSRCTRWPRATSSPSSQLAPGTATVLWHSVVWQYLSTGRADRQWSDDLPTSVPERATRAGSRTCGSSRSGGCPAPSPSSSSGCRPGRAGEDRILGVAQPHGIPTSLGVSGRIPATRQRGPSCSSAATTRSSRSAPSTSTGPARRSPSTTTTSSACSR